MQKILLTHSYFLRFDPKQWATGQPYAPLGTLYAASALREQGHDVSLFDTMFSQSPDEIIGQLENLKPSILILYDDGFNYLTKMCLTNMREAAFKMIQFGKKHNCIVIVSSSDSTDHYEFYIEQGADFILLGEGEKTLVELIGAIKTANVDYTTIDGIAFRNLDTIVKTRRREVIKDLDAIPMPAWDLLDISPYKNLWRKHKNYFSMNMATTRGCPFKCNWCAKPIYGNRYNSRSPGNVVDELLYLKDRFGFDHIWFCDDIFGLKPGWVNEFAGLVKAAGLRFTFKIQARADLLLQENYIRDLSIAGCKNIWMGAESGSQKILDAMDKGTTVEQIFSATILLKKYEIHPSFFIQFGYPGETRNDINKTIRMIKELLPYELGISVSYPLPGTKFYEKVKSQLVAKSNWTDSDELAMMFQNTYAPTFYKKLHRYVHRVYRRQIAIEQIRNIFRTPFHTRFVNFKKAISFLYYAPASILDGWKLKSLESATHD